MTRPDRGLELWSRQGAVAAVLVLLALAAAFVAGQRHPQMREAEVGCLSAQGSISCEMDDDWTISVPRDVSWTGSDGVWHEDGRPACLPPTGRGLEGPVRITWVPAESGARWRQVVHVAC